MARGLNKAQVIGNVGKDPASRDANGQSVVNFSVATSESWVKDGEKKEKTEWHNIVAWGKLADIVTQYIHKGSKVFVEGKLQTRQWEKDGVTRYSTEIVASEILMLDAKGESSYQSPASNAAPVVDDDLPF
tara:strand:+ start:3232 stop:3624 length:393 start_codon:yes stop_codon:yes gene_type:complete